MEDGEPRPAAEVLDGDRRCQLGVERLAGEDVDVAAARELVGVDGQRAGLDELHRRPALGLALAEPFGLAAGGRAGPAKPFRVPVVYLLRCADDSLYCGWTTDVERRLAAHRAATASRYTRSRSPIELAAVVPV